MLRTGAMVVQYAYDTWGKQLSVTGTLASTVGTINPFRYRGYVYDDESGLYYLQSRYYNPEWCRFINADDTDILEDDQNNLMETNLFVYCLNNPVNMHDPSGYAAANIIGVRSGENMNQKVYEFEAIIHKVSGVDGAYVQFPYDVKAEFGKGRVKVHATFDDEPYDGHVPNDQRHVHIIKKGSEVANQNDDGSPHHKNKNKSGELPKKIRAVLKQKTGWDWDAKYDAFVDKYGLDFTMDPTCQIFLSPADVYGSVPQTSPKVTPKFSPNFKPVFG